MSNDIKGLLDNIINNTNNSYPEPGKSTTNSLVTFDKGEFREKLSMMVLKDIVSAMMHDETTDLDGMIDSSIMKHIHDNYRGSCYGYLTSARDVLKSPMIASVIQEIDDKVDKVNETISKKKDKSAADSVTTKDILENVENYDEFREAVKEKVSNQVVDDVAKVITSENDAPVFDKLDDKLKVKADKTEESVILKMTGAIVSEAAINRNPISTEEGINKATILYCISEMDYMFKQRPKVHATAKYL